MKMMKYKNVWCGCLARYFELKLTDRRRIYLNDFKKMVFDKYREMCSKKMIQDLDYFDIPSPLLGIVSDYLTFNPFDVIESKKQRTITYLRLKIYNKRIK